jgi:hypothetical protein
MCGKQNKLINLSAWSNSKIKIENPGHCLASLGTGDEKASGKYEHRLSVRLILWFGGHISPESFEENEQTQAAKRNAQERQHAASLRSRQANIGHREKAQFPPFHLRSIEKRNHSNAKLGIATGL